MMATTVKPGEPDLDAIECDARQRIAELTKARARLARNVFTDESVRQELANVESELASAEAVLRYATLARSETDRGAREAAEQREAQARGKAAAQARKLHAKLVEVARAFDGAADELAAKMVEFHSLAERRAKLLHAAGLSRDPWAPMGAYTVALLAGLDKHGCASWIDFRGGGPPISLEDQCDVK
jgi:hypothetical protein